VDGRRARDLIGVLEERLWHERSAELEAGLRAVMAIARNRLDRLSKEGQ
jgi:2-oxo-4-hydroxy-4-carboxy--5-ureidoimidazoline (OHCU) decarboxylase